MRGLAQSEDVVLAMSVHNFKKLEKYKYGDGTTRMLA